jgi:tetratricopeptide (TPR) repeat protein
VVDWYVYDRTGNRFQEDHIVSSTNVFFSLIVCLIALTQAANAQTAGVQVREENIVLPTYLAGAPEPNPMFYFGRASQGAEGRVYPYPLYDTLTNKKVDKSYKMVYLENEYVRIGILPEIGGRVFEGLDKTNNYHFFYRQHVIKPALIGLIGAWISGGIEWNIPHHHRASTFLPVQYRVAANTDGSKTVWVGELEVRHRMRWAVGYTLYPGKAYMETKMRILNRTPVVHTMLCFANVAVHVNEDYQVIFPPSTQYGTHHHKREFTTWPVSTGRYGGADFSKGVDVSWFKNHDSSNSIFAWNYEDDFLAGYDHGKKAGTMAVADHNIVPGKKLWTWGNGPRGRMWDHILTDEDGPYIELMVGAYSDNQPDYTWLQPYEVKSFEQYWYPFRDIGGVKKANLQAAVNLASGKDGTAEVGFYTTSAHPAAMVTLTAGSQVLMKETVAINPAKPFLRQVKVPAGVDEHDLRAAISVKGKELVWYSPERLTQKPMPKAVEAPPAPQDIRTTEELYLTGLWIEQFHNPTLDPDPYWEEALRRDPGDVRANTALGINRLKKARFAESEKLFRKALERAADRHATPKDAEPTYYLGLALKAQGKLDDAFNAFFKSTWNLAWRAAGYYSLAEIAAARGDQEAALEYADRSLDANALNVRALNLKAALLRHLGRTKEAGDVLATAFRRTDPLDVRLIAERWLLVKSPEAAKEMAAAMNAHPATMAETASEYLNAGMWKDGAEVLSHVTEAAPDKNKISPVAYYYLGYFAERSGQAARAAEYYAQAMKQPPNYVFPFQYEMIDVLQSAMKANKGDARAPYYLGNLLYDWQPDEALKMWERSVALDGSFAIAHRNLGIAYSHMRTDGALNKAIAELERAVSMKSKYPIHFAELDQLYEAAGADPEKRLALLEENHTIVQQRDDALAREVALKVFAGKYDEAIRLMTGRQFSVWEGGSLNVAGDWTDAHVLRGRQRLAAKRFQEALDDFQAALKIPSNLPSERRGGGGDRNAEVLYWTGQAYAAMGEMERARQSWKEAASGGAPARRRPGGEGMPGSGGSQAYYQALSMKRLGENEKANELLREMVKSGTRALEQASARGDFFSSFGEKQSRRDVEASAHYQIALGALGLGEQERARQHFDQVMRSNPSHLGAKTLRADVR